MDRRRAWLLSGALVAVAVGSLVLLWPVLFSPVAADDRYWFVDNAVRTDLSIVEAVRYSFDEIPGWLNLGRVAPLAFVARRVMLVASFKFSVATSTPLVVTQGIAKLLLLVLGIGLCVVFIKSLRWRSETGALVRVTGGRLIAIGVALVPMVASGAQAHSQFRNGWISYPVLTYTAISVIFGAGALVAWCTRRMAERRRGAVWVGVISMMLLGVSLTIWYELYYVAIPLALAALLFPYSPRRRDPMARRAKLIAGGTLSLTFLSGFLVIRHLISTRCSVRDCYVGTEMSFGPDVLVTLWRNFFGAMPGLWHGRFLADLDELGQLSRWPDPATIAIILVSLLIGGGVLAAWGPRREQGEAEIGDLVAERRLLLAVSALALGVGIGGALIMSLSVQAQEVITSVGYPYRHTVLTWTASALALVTLALAVSMNRAPLARLGLRIGLVALIILALSFSLPRNLVSHQVYQTLPANRAIADIHWEVVAGDRSEVGDERRCQSFQRARESINNPWLENRLEPTADSVFRRLYNLPYCSTWPDL